jgi:hypothetical protein
MCENAASLVRQRAQVNGIERSRTYYNIQVAVGLRFPMHTLPTVGTKIARKRDRARTVRFNLKKLRKILYQSRVLSQLDLNALKALVEM